MLKEPPVEHVLIGPRLLDKSRRALGRVYTLALLWRLDAKQAYFDRAVQELDAVCRFADWNPSHFLDTAEMTHMVAIGYDWLYPSLSVEQRRRYREAIVRLGLEPGLAVYRAKGWWMKSEFNWNQVCNGGMTMGALAVAEDEPERSREVLEAAVKSLPIALASYAPDGGWAEGPGYWDYATRYTVYMMAALESATGSDHELSKALGFDQAGRFRVYSSSPTGLSFNYADAGSRVGPCSSMFWLARRFGNPVYAWQEQQLLKKSRPDALDLVWYQENAKSPVEAGWPLAATFSGINVAFARSSWDASDAAFFAIKGGDNKANHSHLDLGTFVFDVGGERHAIDLGGDDYDLPEYFGKLRWSYYRLRSESHNTVLIDGENQNLSAKAKISGNTVDLTQAYGDRLKSWTRTFTLDKTLTLVDRIEAKRPVDVLWGMVTGAEVVIEGRTARLGGKVSVELLSPEGARFEVVSTQPGEPQNRNKGSRKLVVRLPGSVERVELGVRFGW